METAEANEGRLTEVEVRSEEMHPKTVEAFTDLNRRSILASGHISCTEGEADTRCVQPCMIRVSNVEHMTW